MIERGNSGVSLRRQSELLEISRSSLYYQPIINQRDIDLMNLIDQIYTDLPFYGSRRTQWQLKETYHIKICRQYIRRLMRLMGIETIYPRKNTSQGNILHTKYPYLLNNIIAGFVNHIWGTDITYIKLEQGFAYLVAIIDWYSRYVISWKLSPTLEMDFCLENLTAALTTDQPQIHNSDQGSQFTSFEYVAKLREYPDIQISMDGRGRCMDNIFTERLWRTVKYENVYLASYANFAEANAGLKIYFNFYNHLRPHSSLQNQTPAQVYFKDRLLIPESSSLQKVFEKIVEKN